MDKGCIFCKIVKREIPKKILFEDDLVMAFDDIFPVASTHVLIIPKKHIESVNDLTETDKDERLMGRLVLVAKKIAEERGVAEDGYKLLIRTGKEGGQEVPHIHLHLMGGEWKVRPNI
jgi:histidine triad (HIT) family protein